MLIVCYLHAFELQCTWWYTSRVHWCCTAGCLLVISFVPMSHDFTYVDVDVIVHTVETKIRILVFEN